MGLLKGLDPLLGPDLLYVLRSMGHGDRLVVVDVNFPAYTTSQQTTSKYQMKLEVNLPSALDAVLSVLPIDYFSSEPCIIMSPEMGVELPDSGQEVWAETEHSLHLHYHDLKFRPLDRYAFYKHAATCFAVLQTSERRPYGNVILTKGVIGPDGKDLRPTCDS